MFTMRHARITCCYHVQRCLAKPKNIDFKQQRLPAGQFKNLKELLAYPQRADRWNEFKKWIKFMSVTNSKQSSTILHALQILSKLKLFNLRTHKSELILHSEFLQILEKVVLLFPKISVKNILKNDKVDLHFNECLNQPLPNGTTFTSMCSNKLKYLVHLPLTSSGAQLSYHHVATVRHFSTSSPAVAKHHSNIFPKMDMAFLEIFGAEKIVDMGENKDLLILLLNSIVFPEVHGRNIQCLNFYNYIEVSGAIGVEATDSRGEKYNVEIQIIDDFEYQKNPLDYWSGHFSEQLQKTIRIHILGYTYLPEVKEYHNTFVMKEKDRQIKLHTIELEKFHDNDKEGLQDLIKKIKTPLDKWLAFFTAGVLLDKDNLPDVLNDEHIQTALHDLYRFYFYSDKRKVVKDYLKSLRDEWGMGSTRQDLQFISSYHMYSLDQLWIEQESEELERMRVDTAKLMLKYNVPLDEIEKACDLTREEVLTLKNGKKIERIIVSLY